MSEHLVDPQGDLRHIVAQEDQRVANLMTERYVPEHRSRQVARKVLGVVGVQLADKRFIPPTSSEVASREQDTAEVRRTLEASRDYLRKHTKWGRDDVEVDAYLGMGRELGDKNAILPSSFRGWHKAAQDETGTKFTFLQWMTDHATDEQLTNVWQWHDSYLSKLDNDPAFLEQVTRTKADFQRGLKEGLRTHELHHNMAEPAQGVDRITVRHGSPFSAMTSVGEAYASAESNTLYIRPDRHDFILHHEYLHVLYPGFGDPSVNEPATDRLALVTYNNSHAPDQKLKADSRKYSDEMQTQAILERMGDGKYGLYELSRDYAGSKVTNRNWAEYVLDTDAAIGMPITQPLLEMTKGLQNYWYEQGDMRAALHEPSEHALEVVKLLEALANERGGHRDVDHMLDRLDNIAITKRHLRPLEATNRTVRSAAQILQQAQEIQERYQALAATHA